MTKVIHHKVALAMNVLKAHQRAMKDIEDAIADYCEQSHIEFGLHKMSQTMPHWMTFNGLDWTDFAYQKVDPDVFSHLQSLVLFRLDLISTIKQKNTELIELNESARGQQ